MFAFLIPGYVPACEHSLFLRNEDVSTDSSGQKATLLLLLNLIQLWTLSYRCSYTSESNKIKKRERPANCRWWKKNFNKLINTFLYCTCLQGFMWSWNWVNFTQWTNVWWKKWTVAPKEKGKWHYHKFVIPPGTFIQSTLNILILQSIFMLWIWANIDTDVMKVCTWPEDKMTASVLFR